MLLALSSCPSRGGQYETCHSGCSRHQGQELDRAIECGEKNSIFYGLFRIGPANVGPERSFAVMLCFRICQLLYVCFSKDKALRLLVVSILLL